MNRFVASYQSEMLKVGEGPVGPDGQFQFPGSEGVFALEDEVAECEQVGGGFSVYLENEVTEGEQVWGMFFSGGFALEDEVTEGEHFGGVFSVIYLEDEVTEGEQVWGIMVFS